MHRAGKHAGKRTRTPSTKAALIRIGALVLLLAVVSVAGYELGWFDAKKMVEPVMRLRQSYGSTVFGAAFVLGFGICTALGMPALPFAVTSGLLFGTFFGSVLSWAGGMVGAVGGYWLARTVGRDVVTRWLTRFKRADRAISDSRDFTGVLRLRLIPILPLGITNFVGGMARSPFVSYLAATAVGTIPSMVIYAYFADSFIEGVGHGRSSARIGLGIASGLLLLLSFAPRLLKIDSSHPAHATLGNPKSAAR